MLTKVDIDKIERIHNIRNQIVVGLSTVLHKNILPNIPVKGYKIFINDDFIYVGLLTIDKIKITHDKNHKPKHFQLYTSAGMSNKTHDLIKSVRIENVDGVLIGIDLNGIIIKGISNWNMSVLKQIDRDEFYNSHTKFLASMI